MSVTIQIPTPLRRFPGERGEVAVEAATVGEALRRLVEAHADLRPHLYANDGKLRTFVNVFKNDEDVRFLDKDATVVAPGDRLTIIPSIAGGSGQRDRAGRCLCRCRCLRPRPARCRCSCRRQRRARSVSSFAGPRSAAAILR
jgi:adenylyltransferase/sulfurtransferase